MLGGGAYLAARFDWVFYVFGGYLAWQGLKLFRDGDDDDEATESSMLAVLWKEFKATADPSARERLILNYSPLVKYVAGRVSVGPSFAELDGGTSEGQLRSLRIGFDEMASVRYQHGRLHLWRRNGAPLRLGSADRPGALRELAERLKSQLAATVA